MKVRPTESRNGVKGPLPLAGSRDSVPCGVWGNAPTVGRATSLSNTPNKRCRQRSVPASNFARPQTRPQAAHSTNCAVSRQMGATVLLVGKSKLVFIASRGFRACGRESGALRSPPTPLRSAHPCFLVFIVAGDFASAEASRGLCGRPRHPFAVHTHVSWSLLLQGESRLRARQGGFPVAPLTPSVATTGTNFRR